MGTETDANWFLIRSGESKVQNVEFQGMTSILPEDGSQFNYIKLRVASRVSLMLSRFLDN